MKQGRRGTLPREWKTTFHGADDSPCLSGAQRLNHGWPLVRVEITK